MSIEELCEQGYTVIPSLISDDTCNKLAQFLNKKFADNGTLPFNYYEGHYQIHLPDNLENFPEEIILNTKIHSILKEMFGSNYYMYSYTCNANVANIDQPYHMDCCHFHPIDTIKKFGSPGPPIQIIVNLYLQDTDETNGSFDIVPGSHKFTDFEMDEDGRIDPTFIKKSVRCNLPKGSVIIRDKRTWHRGTKNTSGKVRYMIGTGYSLNWYKLGRIGFKKECEEILYDAPFSTWNLDYK